jgi:2-amino-4-hydroxy-6-hydroxymethyldihydropteridine diphosphokinase
MSPKKTLKKKTKKAKVDKMSLIIATGSNLNDRLLNLNLVKKKLSEHFDLIAQSEVFESKAVDYLDQPDFFNQMLEFKIPNLSPKEVLDKALSIEKEFGRIRNIDKGPRIIDIDIIFWGLETINDTNLKIPHPHWDKRSFVVLPLQQLPFFQTLKKCFKIPTEFEINAYPIKY